MGFEYKDIKLGSVLNPGRITAPGALSVKPDNTFRDLALKGAFNTVGGMLNRYVSEPNPTGEYANSAEMGSWDIARDWYSDPKNKGDAAVFNAGLSDWQSKTPHAGKQIVDQRFGGWLASERPELTDNFVWSKDVEQGGYSHPNLGVSPLTVKKPAPAPAPAPAPVATPYDTAIINAKNANKTRNENNATLGLNQVTSGVSPWREYNTIKDNSYLFQDKLHKSYTKSPSAPWWQPEPFMSTENRQVENMNEGLRSWISGERGLGDFNQSQAHEYFRTNPDEWKEYLKNPQRYWFNKINKGKKDINKAW